MKNIVEQLSRYKSVHLNKKNIQTHFVGVPLIILAVTFLLSLLSFELNFELNNTTFVIPLTFAMILYALVALYYFMLDKLLAMGMVVYMIVNLVVADFFANAEHLFFIAIALFILGWIIQFVGHHFEKAKPAFVDDLSQFAIGPLFLMAETYFALGFHHVLKEEITPLAIQKRRELATKLAE
tara:strand:+ start:433 stop:978 length:546 start_codon:yes stop_codon:yes gene_type:complete